MDSLLASYASSDDDDDQQPKPPSSSTSPFTSLPPPISSSSSSKPSSLFSSLPPPKAPPPPSSSSLFSSLPPPKSRAPDPLPDPKPSKRLIFSSLPPPKSQPSLNPNPNPNPNPKRVVQFTLPLNPSLLKPGDLDDDDDEEEERERKPLLNPCPSSSKGLMLPAPKNSLCLAPTAASRRSAFDSGAPGLGGFGGKQESSSLGGEQDNSGGFEQHVSYPSESEQGASGYDNYGEQQEGGGFEEYGNYAVEQGLSGYENYGSYEAYDGTWAASGAAEPSYDASSYKTGAGNYGGYEATWSNPDSVAAPVAPDMQRIVGKRGRKDVQPEIVEVNQAELMKNRPRQDQVKLTGIAFGPAYQAVSTTKGKPSKLHKRKHQIGSLYFDMKQKEMELAERRAKGFLTKAETQAKYGW